MKMPIIEGLKKYSDENNIRFHMPGHKGKNALFNWKDLIPYIDVTEVEGTDNLHNPTSIILESQEKAAEVFGAKRTFFSVNGSTGGIYSAIMAVTKPGDKILIQRNSHKSVYNAAIMGKLDPIYVYPNYSKKDRIVTGINPSEIENMLQNDRDIAAVVVTYPSYYGICSDIKKISEIVHKYNKILIVDEAHGSHLIFSKELPISAIDAGADIVIQSTHKTLPALTQSSMIHVCTDRVDIEKLTKVISVHQTTSPSYLLMSSLDFARAYMEKEGRERLSLIIDSIKKRTKHLKQIKGVKIFDKQNIEENDFYDFDITKLVIGLMDFGISGKSLESILRRDYKIQLEMADYYYGIALISALNEDYEIERLVYAIEDILKNDMYRGEGMKDILVKYINPERAISLHEAFYRNMEPIPFKHSKGKISANFIIPYPPGIPVLCPGEVITDDIIEYIQILNENNIEILGFTDNNRKIMVIK